MAVTAKSDRLYELVDRDAEVEQLGTGFTFTEGPVWNKEGEFLLFSDMPGTTPALGRLRRRGRGREAQQQGQRHGLRAGRTAARVRARDQLLVRMDPDGTGSGRETVASHFEGKELNSPNDVIVAQDGSILFSDPWYGRMPVFGVEREKDLDFQGVYRIPPGGDPQLLADDFEQPNGLCFSPDESLLYINDTPARTSASSTCAATARSRAGGCSSRASAAA